MNTTLAAAARPDTIAHILAVDDDRTALLLLEQQLQTSGYLVSTARSGAEALAMLQQPETTFDAILLDYRMPAMDGLQVVETLKRDTMLARIPVIMQTGADAAEDIEAGIRAGVFYYLTKPIRPSLLQTVVASAVAESSRYQRLKSEMAGHRHCFQLLHTARFSFRTLFEAESLAAFIANAFPNPDRVVSGLAELMINAVEHGNCGLDYAAKTKYLAEKRWQQEIEHRLRHAPWKDRIAELVFQHNAQGWFVRITDAGMGFNWQNYLRVDPSRATDSHGRGIAQAANICFDQVQYNPTGNQVTAMIRRNNSNTLEW